MDRPTSSRPERRSLPGRIGRGLVAFVRGIGYVIGQLFASVGFALKALSSNAVRSLLSLLGVTIGIFTIVMVSTAVSSLEGSIRKSLDFLGSGVIYVQKWPWTFTSNYPWWRYMARKTVGPQEFAFLEARMTEAAAMALIAPVGGRTVEAGSSSFSGGSVVGVTYAYPQLVSVPLSRGRYLTAEEAAQGRQVALIGVNVASTLFPRQDPIGKRVKVRGREFVVIGLMAAQGTGLIGTPTNDNNLVVPYGALARIVRLHNSMSVEPMIMLKGRDDDPGLARLEAQARQLMRAYHTLRPSQEDVFAINQPEMISQIVTGVFVVLSLAGSVIGGFSVLVGAFGIANIMFVSVSERTPLIGIQKALGARRFVILTQFLVESVVLALVGGVIGIGLVWLATQYPQDVFAMQLDRPNIIRGLIIAGMTGVVSGIVPAIIASRLSPVEAIRQAG